MNSHSEKRRQLIKAGLTVPLLANMSLNLPTAHAAQASNLVLPARLVKEIEKLYGYQANTIQTSDSIKLQVPQIAENGQEVQIRVTGEIGLVNSLAVLIEENEKPLAGYFTLHEGADLAVRFNARLVKTSNIYLVAQTNFGLVGEKGNTKVTIGCGGG